MTRFATQFAGTGARNLIKQFGETVGYYNAAGGPVRNVSAIVERRESVIIAEVGDLNGQFVIVRTLDDSTDGIASSELNTGGDEISVALRVGTTAERRSVARVLNNDNGMTRVLVQ